MKTLLTMFVIGIFALPVMAGTDGKSDYNAYCAGCHGANGNVKTEKAKALKMDVRRLSLKSSTKDKLEMITVIESGKGDMPEFRKQLTRERIEAVVDYIIGLRGNK
jgi:mono/diheme cytochrome c family protein